MYMVLFCISVTGMYRPPFIACKGQHLYELWTICGPPGTLYRCSESSWMHDSLFKSWMAFFVNYLNEMKKPVLLIYNGHGNHLMYNTAKLVMDNGIIIICFSPNCSHAIDVGVFYGEKCGEEYP